MNLVSSSKVLPTGPSFDLHNFIQTAIGHRVRNNESKQVKLFQDFRWMRGLKPGQVNKKTRQTF